MTTRRTGRGGLHLGTTAPTAEPAPGEPPASAPAGEAPLHPDTSAPSNIATIKPPDLRAVPQPPPSPASLLPAMDGWTSTRVDDGMDDGERERWRAYLTRSAQGLAAALRTTTTRAEAWARHCAEARAAGIPDHLIERVATDTGAPLPPRT